MNQSAARKYFGSDDAASDRSIDWYLGKTGVPMQVVGVVEDIRNESPTRESKPEIFVDYRQMIARFARDSEPVGRTNEGGDRVPVVRDPHHRRSARVRAAGARGRQRASIRPSASMPSRRSIAC